MLSVCMSHTVTCWRYHEGSRPEQRKKKMTVFFYFIFLYIYSINLNRRKVISITYPTCVVMPDAYFPDFSQVDISFYLKVVETIPLKGSISLQVTWTTFVKTIQTNTYVSRRSWRRHGAVMHGLLKGMGMGMPAYSCYNVNPNRN